MIHVMTDAEATFGAAFITGIFALMLYVLRNYWQDHTVNSAIFAEKQRLRGVIESHKTFWDKCVADHTTHHHPLIPFEHIVYDKHVAHVGVVHRGKVSEIVRFYGYVNYLNQFQKLRDFYDRAGNADEFNAMYLGVLDKILRTFH